MIRDGKDAFWKAVDKVTGGDGTADGEKLIARGQVVRAGRTLIVTQAEVFAVKDGQEKLCALMQQTIMSVTRTEKSHTPRVLPSGRGKPKE